MSVEAEGRAYTPGVPDRSVEALAAGHHVFSIRLHRKCDGASHDERGQTVRSAKRTIWPLSASYSLVARFVNFNNLSEPAINTPACCAELHLEQLCRKASSNLGMVIAWP